METLAGPKPPTGSATETQKPEPKDNPESTGAADSFLDISLAPTYQGALKKLLHPIVTTYDIVDAHQARNNPDLAKKVVGWEAARGRAGIDISEDTSKGGKFNSGQLPQGRKERRIASKITDRNVAEDNQRYELFALERDTYQIDPGTSKSKWRNKDGELPHGTPKRTRRRIERAENEHSHLKQNINENDIRFAGRDPENPDQPTRTKEELEADEVTADLADLREQKKQKLLAGMSPKMRKLLKSDELDQLVGRDMEVRELGILADLATKEAGRQRIGQPDKARAAKLQAAWSQLGKQQAEQGKEPQADDTEEDHEQAEQFIAPKKSAAKQAVRGLGNVLGSDSRLAAKVTEDEFRSGDLGKEALQLETQIQIGGMLGMNLERPQFNPQAEEVTSKVTIPEKTGLTTAPRWDEASKSYIDDEGNQVPKEIALRNLSAHYLADNREAIMQNEFFQKSAAKILVKGAAHKYLEIPAGNEAQAGFEMQLARIFGFKVGDVERGKDKIVVHIAETTQPTDD